jgi:fatty acid desaturase
VLHHSVGHHVNDLDQTKDESRWARADGSRMGEWEYSFVTTATAYPRAWAAGAKYPRQRRLFAVMFVLTAALVAGLVWLRPVPGLILFVLIPLLALFGTAMATLSHHSGRSTASHFVACNNILQPLYNRLTGNLGVHTAHHYRPGVHWSQLPQLHAEIEHLIPADAYVEPGVPWRWLGESPKAVDAPTPASSTGLSAPPSSG